MPWARQWLDSGLTSVHQARRETVEGAAGTPFTDTGLVDVSSVAVSVAVSTEPAGLTADALSFTLWAALASCC